MADQRIRRRTALGLAAGTALAAVGVAVGVGNADTTPKGDPAAAKSRDGLLDWIRSLENRQDNRVLIGQEISSWSADSYDQFVNGLERETGKRPAVVGLSLLEPGDYDAGGVDCLIDHHERGGLVTVSTHWTHPWGDHPPNGDKYRVVDDNAAKPDLRELLSSAPDSGPKRKYWEQVDDLVGVLTRLDEAGAVVLLRPFHEMNGLWFWWGHDAESERTALVDLWKDLHAHVTAKLSNILWVYSPAGSWNAAIAHHYPGPDFVDLAGIDVYSDDLRPYDPEHRPDPDDWTELRKLGHPGGLAEFGPGGDKFPDGAATWVNRLGDTYTTAVFAHSWTSWSTGQERALVEQAGIDAALDQPMVITLDEVDWKA